MIAGPLAKLERPARGLYRLPFLAEDGLAMRQALVERPDEAGIAPLQLNANDPVAAAAVDQLVARLERRVTVSHPAAAVVELDEESVRRLLPLGPDRSISFRPWLGPDGRGRV
jgi:hypothetical protein